MEEETGLEIVVRQPVNESSGSVQRSNKWMDDWIEDGKVKGIGWRQVFVLKVLMVHVLQAFWIGAIISVFLFVPEVRVTLVGPRSESVLNGTSINEWQALGIMGGLLAAFFVILAGTALWIFLSNETIWTKTVPILVFLFLLATTFGLAMGDISCVFETGLLLTGLCLALVSYVAAIIYVLLTRVTRLPFREAYPFIAPFVTLVIGTVIAGVVGTKNYDLPWYNALISFALALFFLVATIVHTWFLSDRKEFVGADPPIHLWSAHTVLRLYYDSSLVMCFCLLALCKGIGENPNACTF